MTAILGILNKRAVAIAADSAVTTTGPSGRKIYNHADKIFALSKYQPMGVMIYNSADFMGVPWETIIKLYKKQLDRRSFLTVDDYVTDFIAFVKNQQFCTDTESQSKAINLYFHQTLRAISESVELDFLKTKNRGLDFSDGDEKVFFFKWIGQKLEEWRSVEDYCEEFKNYRFAEFEKLYKTHFTSVLDGYIDSEEREQEFVDELFELIFHFLCKKEVFSGFTGLVFTGFGDDEIFPSLVAVNISLCIDKRFRYYIDVEHCRSISNNLPSAIVPFAQTDVMDTILKGIAPDLRMSVSEIFEKTFDGFRKTILTVLGDATPELVKSIEGVDLEGLSSSFLRELYKAQFSAHIKPLIDTIETLSKQDLAEMAESLIYLTYLKRRFTTAEESVGGPVDVAIISKGDGFVWIKRKHYFKPELNQNFFSSYFNH